MLISAGDWKGRGRYLYQGQSLGTVVELSFSVTHDEFGEHIEGSVTVDGVVDGSGPAEFSVRMVEDESGTFEVTATGVNPALAGTAKLESEPNLLMLWSEEGDTQASVTLFSISRGIGCRGFYRKPAGVLTWEMVLTPDNPVRRGSNVVSLRRR